MKDKMRVDLYNKMTDYLTNNKYISNVEWKKHYKNIDKYIEQSIINIVLSYDYKKLAEYYKKDFTDEYGNALDIWYDKKQKYSKYENLKTIEALYTNYLRAKFISLRVENDFINPAQKNWGLRDKKWTFNDLDFYQVNKKYIQNKMTLEYDNVELMSHEKHKDMKNYIEEVYYNFVGSEDGEGDTTYEDIVHYEVFKQTLGNIKKQSAPLFTEYEYQTPKHSSE